MVCFLDYRDGEGSAAHTVYTKHQTTKRVAMGTGSSRHEPEVHVVVVQSQENGKVMDAKVLRQSLSTIRTRPREKRGVVCVCVCVRGMCVCVGGR